MPRDSNGVYSLPAGNPVVTLTPISSTWANGTMSDIATALTNSLDRAGSGGMTGQLKLANGLIGAPGLSWSTETTSGLYRNAAGDFRYSVASNDVIQIVAGAFRVVDGVVATPSFSFISDTDTGLYHIGANEMGIAAAGALAFSASSARLRSALAHYFEPGAVGAPSIAFNADTDTGIYNGAANEMNFTAGGALRFSVANTVIVSGITHRFQAGAAATPSITFDNDTNTGIFSTVADQLEITTGGASRVQVATTNVATNIPQYGADGSNGSPQYSFFNDTNTGIYRIGADSMGFSTGGVLRATINSSGQLLYGTREVGYRGLNNNSQAAGYAFVNDDRGRSVTASSAGNFTINSGVFSADDMWTFYTTVGACTLVQGAGVTLRLMGSSGTTGNRSVADWGVATIIAQSGTVFLVGGPGVT